MMRMQHHGNEFNVRNSCAAAADHPAVASMPSAMHRSRSGREPALFHSAFAAEEKPLADRTKAAKNSSGKNGHRHTKRSPSERRFKCEQSGCERMFFTRKDVKRHMVVHTGVRNFPCQFCQQRFGRKDHLVRHAKKSHNRDCRSSASSYALSQQQQAAASFSPQALSAGHSHSKLSHRPPPLLSSLNPVSSAQNLNQGSGACCSSSNGQSPPALSVPQSGSMLLLAQSQASGSGNYSPSCPSVQPMGADFAASVSMMQHHHSQHAAGDVLAHSLSGPHSQSHLSVSSVPHTMAKSSFDGNGYHPFLPVPSAGHFVSHALINPFVGNSSRSLYTSPSAFSAMPPPVPMSDPHHPHHHPHHHAHHHSGPTPTHFPGENPALPHFNQAFH